MEARLKEDILVEAARYLLLLCLVFVSDCYKLCTSFLPYHLDTSAFYGIELYLDIADMEIRSL